MITHCNSVIIILKKLIFYIGNPRYVCIPTARKLHAFNYKAITYVYNSVRTWGLHHRVPHELVILFIYSFCLVLVDKSSKEVV